MTSEATFRVRGFKAVHVIVPDHVRESLRFAGSGGPYDAELLLSRRGVSLHVPALRGDQKTLEYAVSGGRWAQAFANLCPPESALWGPGRVPVMLMGMLAARVIKILHGWRPAPRGRGGPKRGERWDDVKEEFFAAILQNLDDGRVSEDAQVLPAIRIAAQLNPKLFARAFTGSIEAARRDYYRRMEEFEGAPADALILGRIKGIRFEFEDDPTE